MSTHFCGPGELEKPAPGDRAGMFCFAVSTAPLPPNTHTAAVYHQVFAEDFLVLALHSGPACPTAGISVCEPGTMSLSSKEYVRRATAQTNR